MNDFLVSFLTGSILVMLADRALRSYRYLGMTLDLFICSGFIFVIVALYAIILVMEKKAKKKKAR